MVVETHGLRKTFESEGAPVRALRGVDFTMTPGEFVAVMGPSGCGKSTLLNIVAGLDTPTDGDVSLAGEALVGKSEDELAIMRRRHVGIVFHLFQFLARRGGFALLVPHRGIMAVLRQQFGMAAALDDAAVIQHQDLIGIHHGGKPVGNHQRSTVA